MEDNDNISSDAELRLRPVNTVILSDVEDNDDESVHMKEEPIESHEKFAISRGSEQPTTTTDPTTTSAELRLKVVKNFVLDDDDDDDDDDDIEDIKKKKGVSNNGDDKMSAFTSSDAVLERPTSKPLKDEKRISKRSSSAGAGTNLREMKGQSRVGGQNHSDTSTAHTTTSTRRIFRASARNKGKLSKYEYSSSRAGQERTEDVQRQSVGEEPEINAVTLARQQGRHAIETTPGSIHVGPTDGRPDSEWEEFDEFDVDGMENRSDLEEDIRGDNDENELISAVVVDEEGEKGVLAKAEPLSLSRRRMVLGGLLCMMILAAIVTLSVVLTLDDSPDLEPPTAVPSTTPSASPSFSGEGLLESLKLASFDNGTALNSTTTPQYEAAQWIVNHEQNQLLRKYSDGKMIQRYVMATLYYALSGESWSNSNNWLDENTDECNWFLGTLNPCNEDGSLVDIVLRQNQLFGIMPPEIALLSKLETIDLTANRIRGQLPKNIKSLTDLKTLILSDNELSGALNDRVLPLSSLTSLRLLLLDNNNFVCTLNCRVELGQHRCSGASSPLIGFDFRSFSNMTVLSIANNRFGDLEIPDPAAFEVHRYGICTFPTEVGHLTKLREFNFEGVKFEGLLPTELGRLKNLTTLTLPKTNNVLGGVPTELGQLSRLLFLDLSTVFNPRHDLGPFHQRMTTRTLPSEIGQMTNLKDLIVRTNSSNFTGTLFTEIGLLSNLENLDLHDSDLTGPIPTEIGLLVKLTRLDLSGTRMYGTLPTELGLMHERLEIIEMGALRSARAGIKSFTGSIPSQLGLLSRLQKFDASYTGLNGTIPTELGQVPVSVLHLGTTLVGEPTKTFVDNWLCPTRPADLFSVNSELVSCWCCQVLCKKTNQNDTISRPLGYECSWVHNEAP